MLLIPIILACLLLVAWTISILHALLVYENSRFVRGRMAATLDDCPAGHVTLIVPCKGNDLDLADNLRAYLRQDHPDFDAIFVVEDDQDTAVPVVQSIRSEFRSIPSRMVVAGRSRCAGQKIHNLMAAHSQLTPQTEILAFGDADAHPRTQWLRWLVQRLHQPGAGAVTGYRWYRVRRFHLAAVVVTALNNLILGWLGRGQHFLVWGGSWAIRRDLLERIGTMQQWQTAISDDLVVSRCLRAARQNIEFVPQCLCASDPPATWCEAMEFLRRQLTIVRCYQPRYWCFLLLVAGAHTAGLLLSAAIALHQPTPVGIRWLAGISALGLYGFSVLRGLWRYSLIRSAFAGKCVDPRTQWLDILGTPLLSLIGIGLIVSSSWSSTIRWRGIAYQLDADGNVVRLCRSGIPSNIPELCHHSACPDIVTSSSAPCGVGG